MVERLLLLLLWLPGCASVSPQAPPANVAEGDPITQLSGFSDLFACELRQSGSVTCRSSRNLEPPPGVVELDGFCLRTAAGRVFCTDGHAPFREIPGVEGATSVASSSTAACAIRRDHSVVCWSRDEEAHEVRGLSDVRAIAVDREACAVSETGLTTCWKDPRALVEWPEVTEVAQLVVFTGTRCGRLQDGTVACWGLNTHGERQPACVIRWGQPMTFHEVPRAIPGIDRVTQLVASGGSACALRDDGTVRCWDAHALGQESSSPDPRRCARPIRVGAIRGAVRIWMTTDTLCALDAVGTRTCLSESKREAALYGAPFPSPWFDGCRR